MEFFHNLIVSLTSPVNCLADFGVSVATSGAHFIGCVVTNIQGVI